MRKDLMRGLFKDRSPDDEQVYKASKWTRYQWSRHLGENKPTEELVSTGKEKIYSFPRFAHEVFTRLYDLEVQKLEKIKPEDQWAAKAHQEIEVLPDFERLGRQCNGDRTLAGTATHTFCDHVLNNMPEPPPKMQDPEPLRNQVRGLMSFLQQLKEEGKDTSAAEQMIEKLKEEGKQAVQAAVDYASGVDGTTLRNVMREGLEAAQEAVNEQVEQVDAFCGWGTGEGTPQSISAEAKAKLADKLRSSAKLQRLAKEAGRMRRIAAQKQRSKSKHARSEVSDIEQGNDLDRLLPSETVKLLDPIRKLDFYRCFLERSLLQYKLHGMEKEGRGPIVVCIDQSGSMRGNKEIWSKAVALALIQVAAMQDRKVRVIHFESHVRQVDDWEPPKVDIMALVKSMERFYGGGTNFEQPLDKALEAIEKEKYEKADVVFITDGECAVSPAFLDRWKRAKESKKFTCYGVLIGCGGYTLQAFSDKVVTLPDLTEDGHATEVVLDV